MAERADPRTRSGRRPLPRHTKIFFGLIFGLVLGLLVHEIAGDAPWVLWSVTNVAYPLGQVFLRLIFMIVVPLVFSSLVLGILELGDVRKLGRIGAKTLAYTLFASGISVAIGITMVNFFRPGAGVDPSVRAELSSTFATQSQKTIENAQKAQTWTDSLLSLIPSNPLKSAVEALSGEMLALMVFAVFFGVALARIRDPESEPLVAFFSAIQRVSMKIVDWAMAIAPIGVAALMFALTARAGFSVVPRLGGYVGVVVGGLAIQMFVVYSAILKGLAGVPPVEWFFRCREVILTAFSTASSNATLPTSLRTSEEKLGIPPRIGSFVLTVGATGNQNGTALFEGVTVLFLAQVFGVDLTLSQQVTVVIMSILAGVGTAGVPGGSLPLIVIVLQTVGIPPEGIGIILGVDRFLDMCRTTLNVVGDLVCATFVARSEGELRFPSATAAPIVADA
ncbi:MAG TPA: dicarboxylate/amino acid:cation symporter [Thermoanaerobaculia bacterium]|jgi:DAACS family dicarboxylate/amino acid:cation (Na+ or H+) symporter|nr:dicarboxylate/amino acid:cation symporter [Thermoanaerobaculia bacterium]